MDLIFDNPLANMYGPYFLVLYAAVIVIVCVILLIYRTVADRTDRMPVPPMPQRFDPFELAFLRGGENELARTAVFGLLQKGVVMIDGTGREARVRPTGAELARDASPIERDTLEWIGSGRAPADLFTSGGLTAVLARHSRVYDSHLGGLQLICSDRQRSAFAPFRWVGILTIVALGLYKLAAAIFHGRSNVMFMIVLGVIGVIAVSYAARLPRVTKLGEQYLSRLRLAFGSLANVGSSFKGQTGAAGVDPMLLSVGIFGTSVLAGTIYSDYNETFKKSIASGGSCGSGCGSSCSSGDGGGSGCGGGCGGCGGGD